MGDQQDGVGVALQEALQPERRLEVEMVGRLVQQQQVGLGEEHGGERHAHAPAAGEIAAGTGLGLGIEAEAGQDGGARAAGAHWASSIDQPGMDLADPVRVAGRLGLGQQAGAP